MNKTEALELIAEKSIHGRAVLAQYDVIDPTEPLHFNYIAKKALFDLNAGLTGPERRAILGLIRTNGRGPRKTSRLELRIDPAQKNRLGKMAEAAGQSMSEFVLAKVFGGDDNEQN